MFRNLSARRVALNLLAFGMLVVLPAAVLAPAVHAQKNKRAAVKKPVGTTIRLAELKLRFVLPQGFRVASDEVRGRVAPQATFLALGQTVANLAGNLGYITNIGIEAKPLPEDATGFTDPSLFTEEEAAFLRRQWEGNLRRVAPSYRIDNTARGRVGKKGAYFIAGLYDAPGTDVLVRHRSALMIHRGVLYSFNFSANEDVFDNSVAVFEKMLNTLVWTE